MRKPVKSYFSPEFDKVALETQIENELFRIRADFKSDGITQKYLQQSFMDLITMTNAMRGMTVKEQAK